MAMHFFRTDNFIFLNQLMDQEPYSTSREQEVRQERGHNLAVGTYWLQLPLHDSLAIACNDQPVLQTVNHAVAF